MTYGWDDDIEREMAMDGHDERVDEEDGCDFDGPIWDAPEDDDRPIMGGDVYDLSCEPF